MSVELSLRCRDEALKDLTALVEEVWEDIWSSYSKSLSDAVMDEKFSTFKYAVSMKSTMTPKGHDVMVKSGIRYGVTRTGETEGQIIEKEPHPELSLADGDED